MKILVIRFSSLGDIILTFPLLRNLKLNLPDAEIWYLTKKQFSQIVKANPDIDKVIEFENIFKTLKLLYHQRFELIFDLHSNLRSFIFRKFLRSEKKIKYIKDSIFRYMLVRFKYISPRLEKHVVEKYLETLTRAGLKIFSDEITLKNLNFKKNSYLKERKKIVIFQTAFLGDLLLTLPAVKKIKENYPDSFIAMVVREENIKAVESVKEIDLIIPDRKKTEKLKSSLQLINKIRKHKFDTAIIPHRSLRSALICWFSNINERIGFDIKPASFFYSTKIPFKWNIHDVERNIMLVEPITGISEIKFPEIKTSSNILKENPKPFIVINPSSVWPTKRWPDYKFAGLIRKIKEKYNIKPILTGSIKERDHIDLIEKMLPQNSIINLCGKTTLYELMDIIKNADLLITNDSGPMHIAVACGVPVVAIFGPTTRELGFFPYSDKSVVVESSLKCRPCSLHGSKKCPRGHFLCMKLIDVDDVLKAAEKFLKYNL